MEKELHIWKRTCTRKSGGGVVGLGGVGFCFLVCSILPGKQPFPHPFLGSLVLCDLGSLMCLCFPTRFSRHAYIVFFHWQVILLYVGRICIISCLYRGLLVSVTAFLSPSIFRPLRLSFFVFLIFRLCAWFLCFVTYFWIVWAGYFSSCNSTTSNCFVVAATSFSTLPKLLGLSAPFFLDATCLRLALFSYVFLLILSCLGRFLVVVIVLLVTAL